MGGKSSGNDELIAQQKKEAAEARRKEAERQARIKAGLSDIKAGFKGFDDKFYNNYEGGIVDYYMPQVADQYGDARDELTYRLARAGTGRSSAAADATADLTKQNLVNTGDVYAKADTAAGDLRNRVNKEKANAESQVQVANNPDVAVNQALAAVDNLSLEQPDMSPLGEMFKIALVGGANAMTGYRNATGVQGYDALRKRLNTSGTTIQQG
jgi:hypothetical protein